MELVFAFALHHYRTYWLFLIIVCSSVRYQNIYRIGTLTHIRVLIEFSIYVSACREITFCLLFAVCRYSFGTRLDTEYSLPEYNVSECYIFVARYSFQNLITLTASNTAVESMPVVSESVWHLSWNMRSFVCPCFRALSLPEATVLGHYVAIAAE